MLKQIFHTSQSIILNSLLLIQFMRSQAKSLMDFNIPVKKSFILSELQFETEASFYQPYSYKKPEKKIIKKASPLLVLCLAKFYNKYLKNVFLRIKSYKRVKFNVQLLNEKNIRNMKESFFKIYSYTLQKKEQKLVATKQNNKNPSVIFKLVHKTVKKRNRQFFNSLKINRQKKIGVERFILFLNENCSNYDLRENKRSFFDKIKTIYSLSHHKKLVLMHIPIVIGNLQRRMKIQGFTKITNKIYSEFYDQIKKAKHDLSEKIQQKNCSHYKDLTHEKQKCKQAKFNLQHDSSIKNKAKVDLRKNISALYNKSTEQMKKNEKIINQLKTEIEKQRHILESLRVNSSQRIQKLKFAKSMKEKSLKAYQSLSNCREKQEGKIEISKSLMGEVRKVKSLHEYVIIQNQTLRSQINFYENRQVSREDEGHIKQNKVLKELIGTLVEKHYEDYLYQQVFHE